MEPLTLPLYMPKCRYVVKYANKNITTDISDYLTQITYTDHLTGQSDEIELEIEDIDGRWRDSWYPGHGDRLMLEIGWDGMPLVACGTFEIDEIEFAGHPTLVSIRALASGINIAIRTTENITYEASTLDLVAKRIAERQGLILVGSIEPISLDKLTQSESDVAFLSKLAGEYDYAFKIVGETLVFHSISELMGLPPVGEIRFSDIKPGWRIRDQLKEIPKDVLVKSHNPSTGKLVVYGVNNDGTTGAVSSSVSKVANSSDTIKTTSRAATPEVAEAKAQADLAKKNRERTTGSINLQGRPFLMAGNVLQLVEAGELSGEYLINSSRHTLSKSGGYETQVDICRIRDEGKIKEGIRPGQSRTSRGLVVYGQNGGNNAG